MLEHLENLLGEELLSFLFCLPLPEYLSKDRDLGAFNPIQQAQILELRRRLAESFELAPFDAAELFKRRLSLVPHNGKLVLPVFYEENGGTFPTEFSTLNGVEKIFAAIAYQSYPYTLIPTNDEFFGIQIFQPHFYGSDLVAQLFEEIKNSSWMSVLFEKKDDVVSCSGHYLSNSGRGGAVQLSTMHYSILSNAETLMRAKGESGLKSYVENTLEILKILKSACEGDSAESYVFFGISNLSIEPDVDSEAVIRLESGNFHRIDNRLEKFIPRRVRPSDHFDGDKKLKNGLIFQKKFNYRLLQGDFSQHKVFFEKQSIDEQKELQTLLLALLLSQSSDFKPISIVWSIKLDPLSNCSLSWNEAGKFSAPLILNRALLDSFSDWNQKLSGKSLDKIAVAVKRILMAVSQRFDLEDSLLDSVVAWENLFSGSPETMAKVVTPIVRFLYEGADRQVKYKELKKSTILEVRSLMVEEGLITLDSGYCKTRRFKLLLAASENWFLNSRTF